MNKNYLSPIAIYASFLVFYQVGINTASYEAILDLTAKNPTAATTNLYGFLFPKVDRRRALNMISVPNSTLIYINNTSLVYSL